MDGRIPMTELETLEKRIAELEETIRELRGNVIAKTEEHPEVKEWLIWMGIISVVATALKKPWLILVLVGYYWLKQQAEIQKKGG